MASTLRVATLGAGYFSQFHHRAWQRLAGVELVANCDRDVEKSRSAAAGFSIPDVFTELDRMLDDAKPDVLDIVAPPAAHLAAIVAAAARGIDVICQKPFCGTLANAERAVAIAEEAGVRLIVHENIRFQPWYGEIKERLASGSLGRVFGLTFWLRPGDGRGENAYRDRQPYFREMERFLIHETGIHYIDLVRYLFGEVVAVTARLRRINPGIAGEDAGIVILEMADGTTAVFDGNRHTDHKAKSQRLTMGEAAIEAEAGVLRLTGDGDLLLRRHGTNNDEAVDYDWQDIDFGGDCVYRTQVAAAAALTGAGPVVNSGRDYLVNLRIEEAIYRSDRESRRVSLT